MIAPMEPSLPSIEPVSDVSPVAVGGLGGSGTRVVVSLLEALNFDMGTDLNESRDDLTFTALFKRRSLWPPQAHQTAMKNALESYVSSRHSLIPPQLSQLEHVQRAQQIGEELLDEEAWQEPDKLEYCLKALQRVGNRPAKWGWKEPNTHLFLPYLLSALPHMKYIHVVRNGLDMAFSSNQNQLALWGESLLGRPVDTASPQDAFSFWCVAHDRLLSLMPTANNRILLLGYESLITDQAATLARIGEFLSLSINDRSVLAWQQNLRAPSTVGRHLTKSPLITTPEQDSVLERLGYLQP